MKKSVVLRGSAIAFGAALLVSAGSAALAAETEQGESQGVDVEVQIDPIEGQGALAMTVAASSTSLEENGSTELERVFTGTLPTVTVTDTRAAEDVPADAAWYVVGTASDFYDDVNDQTIAASHLGWSPQLVEGAGEAYVEVGGDVTPSDPGLVDQELLYLAESSEANAGGGVFSATANLDLVVPADVPAGTYSSTITLSLFE